MENKRTAATPAKEVVPMKQYIRIVILIVVFLLAFALKAK